MRKGFLGVWMGLFIWSCSEEADLPAPYSPYPNILQHLTINPEQPLAYAAQYPVHYSIALATDNTPANNPVTDAGASLGRVLFYDVELSVNRSISCASCHLQAFGFTDTARFSKGFEGLRTPMHSMRLGNGRFYAPGLQFWNRRSISIEDQSTQPIQDHIEMGFDSAHGGMPALIARLEQLPYYPELFTWAFGDAAITEERMQKALAQFVRSMVSVHSKFDEGYAQTFDPNIPGYGLLQDFPNFTEQENQGKLLFMTPARLGGAGCNDCHQAPAFTMDGPVMSNGVNAGETTVFKSPALKNVAMSGPYMHGGQVPTLMDVIEHYNSGVQDGPALDPLLRNAATNEPLQLNLPDRQKNALLAFLLTLDDAELTTDVRFSDPFR